MLALSELTAHSTYEPTGFICLFVSLLKPLTVEYCIELEARVGKGLTELKFGKSRKTASNGKQQ